ncbi:MAG TPA: hypothetical protein VFS20_28740 [Longimicrobium sp.]|nr:hypothetical protein [Longimicrobium sp.]
MAEKDPNELSVEELEDVAGGTDSNGGCTINGNCPCRPAAEPTLT